jgi:hypothetical protein
LHGFIGAIDHEEIALSLLGEIVRDRRKPQRAAGATARFLIAKPG